MYAAAMGLLTLGSNLSVNAQTKVHYSEKRLKADTSKADFDGPYIFYTQTEAVVKQIVEKNQQATLVSETFKNPIAGKKLTCYVDNKEHFSFKGTLSGIQAVPYRQQSDGQKLQMDFW